MHSPNWERIRAHYRHNAMAIHQAGASEWGIDPYAWDHDAGIKMSPIESALWHDIRAVGVVLYPQYPVGRRFVDFGNPCAKVAIECDGAQFHQNADADQRRQREIEALGWTVYRLTGRECKTVGAEWEDDNGSPRYTPGEAHQRIARISEVHGIRLWGPATRARRLERQEA